MGFLKKIFGKKDTEIKQENEMGRSLHVEEWDFYFSNVDDIIGSFYVDLGLINVAPIIDKPNLIWVSVQMNNPKENGLSSNEEFEKLVEIEERLQEFISKNHTSVYVGRLTNNGNRDFYFYLGDITVYDKIISEAMIAFSSYTYEFGIKKEDDWKSYFEFMYPNPKQYQSIQNRRVIENLEENGDKFKKARQVDHWIYFKNKKDREGFFEKIKGEGFQIIDQGRIKQDSEFSYSLHIARIDKVDMDSVDDYVLHLWELAGKYNGDYDGWETSVETD